MSMEQWWNDRGSLQSKNYKKFQIPVISRLILNGLDWARIRTGR